MFLVTRDQRLFRPRLLHVAFNGNHLANDPTTVCANYASAMEAALGNPVSIQNMASNVSRMLHFS